MVVVRILEILIGASTSSLEGDREYVDSLIAQDYGIIIRPAQRMESMTVDGYILDGGNKMSFGVVIYC